MYKPLNMEMLQSENMKGLEIPPQLDSDVKANCKLRMALVVQAPIDGGPKHAEDLKIDDPTPASSDSEEAAVLEFIRTFKEATPSLNEPSKLPDPMDYLMDTYLASKPNEQGN